MTNDIFDDLPELVLDESVYVTSSTSTSDMVTQAISESSFIDMKARLFGRIIFAFTSHLIVAYLNDVFVIKRN